jgi:Cytochrome P460
MTGRISVVILTLVVLAGYQLVSSQKTSSSKRTVGSRTASFNGYELVDKAGSIRKPADYRDHYQSLGTWAVVDPNGNQLHVVYASPGAAEYYRKNGKFGDGTVLVKEVFGTDHAQMTTGDAYRASAMIQWFVMIKDEKGRYPNNPLWGDGWGWALFKPDAPEKQVATDYKKDCLPCHIPAKSTGWTYVQGYPVLKSK